MLSLDFPGVRKLIQSIDAAVAAPSVPEITSELRNSLCRMIRDQDVRLPDCIYEAEADHYARREIYRSEEHGYSVIAMTWGPGQGTQIHDHSGMWCVEGVWHGGIQWLDRPERASGQSGPPV
jgi:predicted metal-dependent enzyme (double-stranded beta helix superfamily)